MSVDIKEPFLNANMAQHHVFFRDSIINFANSTHIIKKCSAVVEKIRHF